MEKYVLHNGVRLIYKHIEGEITSFSLALEAGANSEKNFSMGIAHALEHMVFKGTEKRTEKDINEKCDELFGFNNAMTNFPYVIYYGTLTNDDFCAGLNLYGDIIKEPKLSEDGFKEEVSVILEECREWKEDLEQYCEDELLLNSFSKRRFKEIIIGNKKSLEDITLNELVSFYKDFYVGENLVVSVVTSIDFEEVVKIIKQIFEGIPRQNNENFPLKYEYENMKCDVFKKEVLGFNGSKIMYGFDISHLNEEEIESLKLFNLWFGDGISSKLYDLIRTKEGLAYEITSYIKNEKGIKLFIISCSCSKENIKRVMFLIERALKDAKEFSENITDKDINKLSKRLKLKRALELERSIVLANRLAIYEIMYGNFKLLEDEVKGNIKINKEIINNTINKTLDKYSVQILK